LFLELEPVSGSWSQLGRSHWKKIYHYTFKNNESGKINFNAQDK